jgi:hypothetical protein
VTQNSVGLKGVGYIDARKKKDSGTLFRLASFSERTSGTAFRHKITPDSTSINTVHQVRHYHQLLLYP